MTRGEALAIVADPESGFNKGTFEWGEMSDLVLALARSDQQPPKDDPVRVVMRVQFSSMNAAHQWIASMEAADYVLELQSAVRPRSW